MAINFERKILFIQPSLQGVGGIEKVIPALAKNLSNSNYSVSAGVFYNSIDTAQSFWQNKYFLQEKNTLNYRQRLIKAIKRLFFLRKIVRDSDPDVLIVSAQGATIIVLLAKALKLLKTPVVVYVHESVDASGSVYFTMMKLVYCFADSFICVSNGLRDEIVEKLNIETTKVSVAYNSIPPKASTHDKNLPTGYERPYLITASRLETVKGVDVLIELFNKYAHSNRGTLFIFGTGSLEIEMKERIKYLGMENRVFMCGYSADVPGLVSDADVYVSCAKKESFGLGLLEALSVGVPVVCTDVLYGPREIMDLDKNLTLLYPYLTTYGSLFSDSIVSVKVMSERFTTALENTLSNKNIEKKGLLVKRAAYFSVEKQTESVKRTMDSVLK